MAAAPPRQRVAVFVQLTALEEDARRQGGELAFRKLLRSLAGERRVVHAVCYLPQSTTQGAQKALQAAGFTLRFDDGNDQLGADLRGLATDVDAIVLAPLAAAETLRLDAAALPRIEVATFDGTAPSGAVTLQLGRDCLFVP